MANKKMSGIHISRKGLFVWTGLIIFIAGWMFVLGIMVGRGTMPVNMEMGKLDKELADNKEKMLSQEKAKVEAQVSGEGSESSNLGFYEALKSSKKEEPFKSLPKTIVKPKPAPAPKKAAAKPKPAPRPKKAAAKPKPAPKPKTRPAQPKKPAVAAKSKPTPPAKPSAAKTTEKGRFAIQVAAVQDARSAEQLAAKLRQKGYRAYRLRSQVPGKGVWYRVRVGAFEDRAVANKMLAKLKANNFGGMIVSTQ